jgi:hypothetical protein
MLHVHPTAHVTITAIACRPPCTGSIAVSAVWMPAVRGCRAEDWQCCLWHDDAGPLRSPPGHGSRGQVQARRPCCSRVSCMFPVRARFISMRCWATQQLTWTHMHVPPTVSSLVVFPLHLHQPDVCRCTPAPAPSPITTHSPAHHLCVAPWSSAHYGTYSTKR